jgi:hypothetical protein
MQVPPVASSSGASAICVRIIVVAVIALVILIKLQSDDSSPLNNVRGVATAGGDEAASVLRRSRRSATDDEETPAPTTAEPTPPPTPEPSSTPTPPFDKTEILRICDDPTIGARETPTSLRVSPPDPLHTGRTLFRDTGNGTYVALPPIDFAALYPLQFATWELEYILQDLLPRATSGGQLGIAELHPRQVFDPNHPVPPVENLTAPFLFNRSSARRASSSGVAVASNAGGNAMVPTVFVAHVFDTEHERCPDNVAAKLNFYKPRVVFVVSDEFGTAACLLETIKQRTSPKPRLYLRQYGAKSLNNMNNHHDYYTLPLGYRGDFVMPRTLRREQLTRASARRVVWSFVGGAKGSRGQLVASLGQRYPESIGTLDGKMSRVQMARLYGMSKFVLSPRGFQRMDCSRLYEASKFGAIPIVMCDRNEAGRAWDNFIGEKGDIPPWLYAPNIQSASEQMDALMASADALDKFQDAVLRWWDRVNANTARAIYDALTADDEVETPTAG